MTEDSEQPQADLKKDLSHQEDSSPRLTAAEIVRKAFRRKSVPDAKREAPKSVMIPIGGDSITEAVEAGEKRALDEDTEQKTLENEINMRTQLEAILAPYEDGITELAQALHLRLEPKRKDNKDAYYYNGVPYHYEVTSLVKGPDGIDHACRLRYNLAGIRNKRFSEIIYEQALTPNSQLNNKEPRIIAAMEDGKINYASATVNSKNDSYGRDFWDKADEVLGIDSTTYDDSYNEWNEWRGHSVAFFPQGVLEPMEPTLGYNTGRNSPSEAYYVYDPKADDFYRAREIGSPSERKGPKRQRFGPRDMTYGGRKSFDGTDYTDLLQRALTSIPTVTLPQ
ncbi:MAG TPA: hypothetical protein VLF93_07915 [Candidatus Saccharimonadales bacterium]|nr:hypothetical protein [Candidatus Saccharimonadales bacterium]